jgi:hypothetical protein
MPYLRRRVRTREDFGSLVETLDHLVYEGTFGRVKTRRTLPSACYDSQPSIIRIVHEFKKHWARFGNPALPLEPADVDAVRRTSRELAGVDEPTTDLEFERLANGLKHRVISFIGGLAAAYPFTTADDTKIAHLVEERPQASILQPDSESKTVLRVCNGGDAILCGVVVKLPPTPFKILTTLASRPGKWTDLEKFLDRQHNYKSEVTRLRRAFRDAFVKEDLDGVRSAMRRLPDAPSRWRKELAVKDVHELFEVLFENRTNVGYRLSLAAEDVTIESGVGES